MAGKAWSCPEISQPAACWALLRPEVEGFRGCKLSPGPSLAEMELPPELKTGLEPTFCRCSLQGKDLTQTVRKDTKERCFLAHPAVALNWCSVTLGPLETVVKTSQCGHVGKVLA